MQKLFRCLFFAVAVAGVAAVADAGELTVKIADGRATVIARDVPVRQILAEWARVGNTKIVHAEKLTGGPISLELVDVPEKDALDILLRSAAGYLAAPRPDATVAGASQFDRVIILATSRPPAPTASVPAPFNIARPALTQMPPQAPPDDVDPGDQGPNGPNGPPPGMQGPPPAPGMQTPGMPFPPPGVQGPNANPNVPNQQPVTSPRPGMLPQPPQQQVPPNPYAPGVKPIPNRPGGEQ
jgi:hypothetical protein